MTVLDFQNKIIDLLHNDLISLNDEVIIKEGDFEEKVTDVLVSGKDIETNKKYLIIDLGGK